MELNLPWKTVKEYQDITYKHLNGVARIAFNRPEVRNAFRPTTVGELLDSLHHAHEHPDIGVILLTGEGPSPRAGSWCCHRREESWQGLQRRAEIAL